MHALVQTIALSLLIAMGVVSPDAIADRVVLGELALDESIQQVSVVLPAAPAALASGQHLICPAACGPEAAWASGLDIIAAPNLVSLLNHLKGGTNIQPARAKIPVCRSQLPGYERSKGKRYSGWRAPSPILTPRQ